MPARERFDVLPRKTGAAPLRRGRSSTSDTSKYDHRRAEIMDAAIEPLNVKGVKGATLAEVGARLGLAPTAAGYYFRRKEDLAAACLLQSIERMNVLIAEAATMGPDTEAPYNFIRRMFAFRRQVELGEAREIAWFEDVRTIGNDAVNAGYGNMFSRIRALFGEEVTPENRPVLNARTHLFLSQFYWAIGWLGDYHVDDYADLAETVINLLRQGLAAPGRAWAPKALDVQMLTISVDGSREAFLRAATDLINEEGYLGASVQKISARLNVTKGSFYHHHDAKDDVVGRCFERTWEIMRAVQVAADRATTNGLDSLTSLSAHVIEGELTGDIGLLRTSALAAAPSELRPVFIRGFDRTSSRIATVISNGIADGSIRPVDVPVAANMIGSLLYAAAELGAWTTNTDPARAMRLYTEPLFTGMRVEA